MSEKKIEIRDKQVYEVETWEDGSRIEKFLGEVVGLIIEGGKLHIRTFNHVSMHFESKEEFELPSPGVFDDELEERINGRLAYWKSEGFAT
jgi:hypothetical protein